MRLPARLLAVLPAFPMLLVLASVPAAAGPPGWAARLDPRLAAATAPGSAPVAVWVEFVDKGETGPADLAERLAAAERALTPEARHRRLKAHVTPLVDWLDLPLESAYVRAVQAAGFEVYGQSRWFNRVAVHAGGARLGDLAALPFVRHVAPVDLAQPREREPVFEAGPEPAPPAAPGRFATPSAAQVLYGQTFTQLQRLNVPALHDAGYTGLEVNVCILDDGFNWYRTHEALKLITVGFGRTRDFIRGVADVQDTLISPGLFEHGTTTLSVLAGRKPGVYIAPAYGCNVILGRTEDSSSEKPIEMVYWGMGAEWADSLGADIISSSLGYNLFPDSAGTDITYPMLNGHTTLIMRAAEIAAAKGILIVNSAGNDGNFARVGRKISAPADANGDSVLVGRGRLARRACQLLVQRPHVRRPHQARPRRPGRGRAHGGAVLRQPVHLSAGKRHVVFGAARGRARSLPHAGAPELATGAHHPGAQADRIAGRAAGHAARLGHSQWPRRTRVCAGHVARARRERSLVAPLQRPESAAPIRPGGHGEPEPGAGRTACVISRARVRRRRPVGARSGVRLAGPGRLLLVSVAGRGRTGPHAGAGYLFPRSRGLRPARRGARHRAALTDGARNANVPRMNNSPRFTCVRASLTLFLLVAATLPAAVAGAGPLDAMRITLKNGMQVVLAPDSLAMSVDVAVWFPSGTRHEKASQAGLALLCARLGFRNGATDPLAPLAAEGGSGTLVVTPDFTSFSATVPASAFDRALAFIDERMPGNATTSADLAAERAALRVERARPDRTPVARALARLWATAWPGHPYALTGAAPSPGAESLTPADVDAWRRARFAASSAVLVVAGAFDSERALTAIRDRFEASARVPALASAAAAAPRTAGRGSERIDSQARLCLVGWRGPGAGDPDAPALELLAAWLGGSPQARLARSLVTEWHLAVAAQAGFTAQKDGSLLWTLAVVPPGVDSSAVESTLLEAATAVAKTAPETFELERARRQLEAGVLFALQTSRQRSQALGDAELLAGDVTAAARRLDTQHRLTAEDLRRVAARVMIEAGRATVWMLPAGADAGSGGAR